MTKHWMMSGLLALLPLMGCASADGGAPVLGATMPVGYRLGTGDELRINVGGLDALNNTYLVDDTGAIALPMLQPVTVAGLTIREAEAAIAAQILARKLVLEPQVSAQVQSYRPFFIVGEVQKPGQYPYIPGMSLTTAVTVAGGYTFRANKRSATILRVGVKGSALEGTPVLPGDVITVRESWF